jgi:hypothetical protein
MYALNQKGDNISIQILPERQGLLLEYLLLLILLILLFDLIILQLDIPLYLLPFILPLPHGRRLLSPALEFLLNQPLLLPLIRRHRPHKRLQSLLQLGPNIQMMHFYVVFHKEVFEGFDTGVGLVALTVDL